MSTNQDIGTGSTLSGEQDKIISDCEDKLKEVVAEQERDEGRKQTMLVSFESGHYKKIKGEWKGDSIWTHWVKPNGKCIHINKDKVEYYEEL